jgi:hypothetical protein
MVEQHTERYYAGDYAIDDIQEFMAEHRQRGWMVKCMQTVGMYLLVVYERQCKEETSNKNID